jgi:hypothetical protein
MIFLVKAGIDPISADLDSVASGLNSTRVETRGCLERAALEEVANRSRDLGFVLRERKLP